MHRPSSKLPILPTLAVLGLVALLFNAPLLAGERDLSRAEPESVGMSSEGLAQLSAKMHEIVDSGQLHGVITAVARRGKLVHWDEYGYADKDNGVKMQADTIFRIYSMTKPTAGVALMTLWEDGKFKLSDPVEKYLPEFKGIRVWDGKDPVDGQIGTVPADHPMTIQELVSHTGGLTYGLFARSAVDTAYQEADILDTTQTLEEFVTKLTRIPLKTQPGSTWEYSVSVDVQGRLVEVLSGKSFDEYLRTEVFEPLGMKDTGFWVPPEKADRLAILYAGGRDGSMTGAPNGPFLSKPAFFSGGGGLVSTTMDYLRFAQMLGNGGELDGVRILKPETVELMHTNMLPDSIDQISPLVGNPGNEFGIDFALVSRPDGKTDHELGKSEFWWYGIGGTWFGVNPTQDLVIVGMIQLRGGRGARAARLESKKLAYEAILDPVR